MSNPIKQAIPNAITSLNLLLGCLAIIHALSGDLLMAAYMIWGAAIADFFDGMAARLLKVTSPIGKDLDSLADVVSFGVAPAMILFQMLQEAIGAHMDPPMNLWQWAPLLIPVFSALRLAKFNHDTRQTESFIGLPTPANGIVIASFPLIIEYSDLVLGLWLFEPSFLIGYSILFSILLVAELPLFSLKFKHFRWQGNQVRFIFLALALVLLVALGFMGVPFVIFWYISLSLFYRPKLP